MALAWEGMRKDSLSTRSGIRAVLISKDIITCDIRKIRAVREPKQQKSSAPYKHKQRMKRKVAALLAFFILLFAVVYVPYGTFEVEKRLGVLLSGVTRIGIGGGILGIIQWMVFAQDHLANGTSNASKFFRHCYGSSYAVEFYRLPIDRARMVWFDYFNQWAADDHPNNVYFRTNFERSYSLRLIFYLKRLLFGFSVCAFVVTLIWLWRNRWQVDEGLLTVRLVTASFVGALAVWLAASNRAVPQPSATSYNERFKTTGAYDRFNEIAGILRVKFEDEVLSKQYGPKKE